MDVESALRIAREFFPEDEYPEDSDVIEILVDYTDYPLEEEENPDQNPEDILREQIREYLRSNPT